MKLIGYLRVSTTGQERSGLGLDGQREAVERYAEAVGGELVETYVETESGTRNDRPQLRAAIAHARGVGGRLTIARLDRLSRNAAFLMNLRDSGVDFVACDVPEASTLTVGVLALVAQQEREAVAERTRAGLDAIKRQIAERGSYTARSGRVITRLGGPEGSEAALARYRAEHGNRPGVEAARAAADAHAESLRFAVERAVGEGVSSRKSLTRWLDRHGFKTCRGGKWHASTVKSLLHRLGVTLPSPAAEAGPAATGERHAA